MSKESECAQIVRGVQDGLADIGKAVLWLAGAAVAGFGALIAFNGELGPALVAFGAVMVLAKMGVHYVRHGTLVPPRSHRARYLG